MAKLEAIDAHVAELDARVSQFEDALILDCLDLRYASVFGADEFRVQESLGG